MTAPARRRWAGPRAGILTILVVAVPAMVVAEDWRGHPMIDDAGSWWLVPAAVVVLAFFVGGAVAGRARPGPSDGTAHGPGWHVAAGVLAGAVVAAMLVGADGLRRALFNPTLPSAVVDYWIDAAAMSVVASALGALAVVAWQRRSRTARPAAPGGSMAEPALQGAASPERRGGGGTLRGD